MATETQFTPGPWYLTQSEAGAPRYIREEDSDAVLAYVEDGGHVDPQFALSEDEQLANGRLMASAPDLLLALQKIEHRLFAFGHVQTNLDRHDVSAMIDVARRAISKAIAEQVSA